MRSRPSVCFAAPGHTLLSTAGSTRNILATAAALSEWVDVTVAFRNVAESISPENYRIEEISPAPENQHAIDDVAARGLNPLSHLSYLKTLRNYASRSASSYDLVFEKGWRLSGYLCREFTARGVHSILIENDARIWNENLWTIRSVAKYMVHAVAQFVARNSSRRASHIVAETDELKAALVARRGLPPDKISVVPLGVDHSLFRPMAQRSARHALGLSNSSAIMLYVGGMDQYHDLSPLLEALHSQAPAGLEIHLVGDGEYRRRYENLASSLSVPVVFHGLIEHEKIPDYIAAADICLAPYQASGFYRNQLAFSTLKIPEYMACGRPVISIPSGHILSLIEDGVTGFLFDNESASWQRFLQDMPSGERFAAMGRAAAPTVASLSWSETARRYLILGSEVSNMPLYCDSDHGKNPVRNG